MGTSFQGRLAGVRDAVERRAARREESVRLGVEAVAERLTSR